MTTYCKYPSCDCRPTALQHERSMCCRLLPTLNSFAFEDWCVWVLRGYFHAVEANIASGTFPRRSRPIVDEAEAYEGEGVDRMIEPYVTDSR